MAVQFHPGFRGPHAGGLRRRSGTPRSYSMLAICWLSEGCDTDSMPAALERLPISMTATKQRRWRRSTASSTKEAESYIDSVGAVILAG